MLEPVAVFGRMPPTVGIGIVYVFSVPGSVAYFWITGEGGDDEESS